MSLAFVKSRVLVGLEAVEVTVEVHLANGLPSFTLVGLADVEVKEARERVRSAIQNSGLDFPNNKRITVNLAPADVPKDSGRLDLAIALGILAASAQVPAAQLAGFEFAGELSLSGELRPVHGALAMALAMQTGNAKNQPKLVLPPKSAEEAALVPDAQVYRAEHLTDVVAYLNEACSAQSGTSSTDNAHSIPKTNPQLSFNPNWLGSAGYQHLPNQRTAWRHVRSQGPSRGQTRSRNCGSGWSPCVAQRPAWIGQVDVGASLCGAFAPHGHARSLAKCRPGQPYWHFKT